MAINTERELEGLIHSSGVVTVAVINTPQMLYQYPYTNSLEPTPRTVRITKITATARGVASGYIKIGTGLGGAFVQRLIDIDMTAGLETILTEDEIPEWWFGESDAAAGSITFQGTALYVIQIEVEERGS